MCRLMLRSSHTLRRVWGSARVACRKVGLLNVPECTPSQLPAPDAIMGSKLRPDSKLVPTPFARAR